MLERNRIFDQLREVRTELVAFLLRCFSRVELARNPVKIIAITGSVGKTTTKECVALVLQQEFSVRSTLGSENDRTGVPSTILNVKKIWSMTGFLKAIPVLFRRIISKGGREDFLVLEVAARIPGQIRKQVSVFDPDISVVMAIAPAHLSTLGSIENIIEEKSRIVSSLPSSGVAILCGDDPNVRNMSKLFSGKSIFFGFSECADVKMKVLEKSAEGIVAVLSDSEGEVELKFHSIINRYHLYSIMAAWCVGRVAGVNRDRMISVLQDCKPKMARGTVEKVSADRIVFNDSFNANPLSMTAAIETFGTVAANRRKILVLSDMLELGECANTLHLQVGREAGLVADLFVTYGDFSRYYLEGFEAVGARGEAYRFESMAEASCFIESNFKPGDAIMFKGSHGTDLYNLADKVCKTFRLVEEEADL